MCPDEELLSSFLDGEVPSPWKERIEKHLDSCTRCSEKLEAYRRLAQSLAGLESPSEKASLAEAKARIAASLVSDKPRQKRGSLSMLEWAQNLLSARIALPVPLLALGAAVFVFLAGVMFGAVRILPGSSRTLASSTKTIDSPRFGAEALASYMREAQIQPVTIEMPGEASMDTYGNPVFVASEPMMIQVSTTLAGNK
jgi:anti-sigma factor RsiW